MFSAYKLPFLAHLSIIFACSAKTQKLIFESQKIYRELFFAFREVHDEVLRLKNRCSRFRVFGP
jgi:hypothetical protein